MPSTDARGNPQSEQPAQTPLDRQRILDVAFVCFQQHGYDGTTIRRIAGILQCAVGSIYRYFKDKRHLLATMAERQFQDVSRVLESGGSFEKSMRQYATAAQEAPQMYRLMFWLASVGAPGGSDGDAPSMTANAGIGKPNGLPVIVREILSAWSRILGDDRVACQAWAMLHGSLMLGMTDQEAVQEALALVNTPFPAAVPPVRVARASTGSPIATTTAAIPPQPPAIPPQAPSIDTASPEDVTLL